MGHKRLNSYNWTNLPGISQVSQQEFNCTTDDIVLPLFSPYFCLLINVFVFKNKYKKDKKLTKYINMSE